MIQAIPILLLIALLFVWGNVGRTNQFLVTAGISATLLIQVLRAPKLFGGWLPAPLNYVVVAVASIYCASMVLINIWRFLDSRRSRTSTSLCLLVVALLSGWVSLAAQEGTIRVDVQTVSVGVDVLDSNGRPVNNLTKDDFRVYEDGRQREVLNFASTETPYNLALLFDCSESTENHWPIIGDAVRQFSKFRRAEDRVLVAAFGSKIEVIQDFGTQSPTISFDRNSRICSGTRLHDAIDWAVDKLRPMRTRRGVVILTDGVDSADDADLQVDYMRTVDVLRRMGIPVYIVAIGTDLNPTWGVSAHPPEVRTRLERLAEVSGGRVVFPKTPADVAKMYEDVGRELGTSYSLGFAPGNLNPGRRRIQVRVSDPKLTLRQSRDSYVWN